MARRRGGAARWRDDRAQWPLRSRPPDSCSSSSDDPSQAVARRRNGGDADPAPRRGRSRTCGTQVEKGPGLEAPSACGRDAATSPAADEGAAAAETPRSRRPSSRKLAHRAAVPAGDATTRLGTPASAMAAASRSAPATSAAIGFSRITGLPARAASMGELGLPPPAARRRRPHRTASRRSSRRSTGSAPWGGLPSSAAASERRARRR